MNLIEAINSVDMAEVINGLNAYAISRLKSVNLKTFNGIEPTDFVGDIILKVMEGERDWSKAKCTFKEFLFGCVRSAISNFFKSEQSNHVDELPIISVAESYIDFEEKRKRFAELLKQEGADDDELTIFEYWMDGIFKPAEIASDLGITSEEIYNITKRLERRLPKIRMKAMNIL